MLKDITIEAMQAQLHQAFTLEIDGNKFEVELVEVSAMQDPNKPLYSFQKGRSKPAAAPTNKRTPFAAVFWGPAEMGTEQKLYVISQPEREPDAIFLVPIADDEMGLYFEAVFT